MFTTDLPMMVHPSVTAPYVPPPPLDAVAKMPVNAPCWCRSGDKWKKCHRGRAEAQPINIFELEEEMRRRFERGFCSHAPSASSPCGDRIVGAHTIQRRGGLAAIAENGHVYTVKPTMKDLLEHEGRPPPRKVGVRKASVFPGFCDLHDNGLFGFVEGADIKMDAAEALAFAYRAIAYEHFTKSASLACKPAQRQIDRGCPLELQQEIQRFLFLIEKGEKRGRQEVAAELAGYAARIEAGRQAGFHHRAYRFDSLLPLVASGAFMPEFDLTGRVLQRLARGVAPLEHLSLTITSFAGRSVAFFGWLGSTDGPCAEFVQSFESVADGGKADALVQIAFEALENIFLRISWWDELSDVRRQELQSHIMTGTLLAPKTGSTTKLSPGPALVTSAVIERSAS